MKIYDRNFEDGIALVSGVGPEGVKVIMYIPLNRAGGLSDGDVPAYYLKQMHYVARAKEAGADLAGFAMPALKPFDSSKWSVAGSLAAQ